MFSCEKFQKNVYSLRFVVENNHEPLISTFQRALSKSLLQIQRFLLQLPQYNFQLNYVSGNRLFLANMLSRLALPDSTSKNLECTVWQWQQYYFVHFVVKSCQISEDNLQKIIAVTKKDNILQSVALQIQNGWIDPESTKVKLYLTLEVSLTLYKGLTLKILHQRHTGIERTKVCVQSTVYWPGISKDNTELISNYDTYHFEMVNLPKLCC